MAASATFLHKNPVLTPAPKRSELHQLLQPDAFLWSTGIEDTFVYDPHHTTGRILDEYELTKHYERWREDLDLMAELKVPAARYGIPWYKVEPERGKFNWDFADRALEGLLQRGIHPIIDLIHYSTPPWMEEAWLHPDFPKYMADYGRAVADRYKDRIYWYTPLNEPRITAHYCGRIGWWPPYRHGWKGLVEVLISLAKGIIETEKAIGEVSSENVRLHVDATEWYESMDPQVDAQRDFRQELVALPTDLITGRMTEDHALWNWMHKQAAKQGDLDWLRENAIEPDVIGINLYPIFSRRQVSKGKVGTKFKSVYGTSDLVYNIGKFYWERFKRPLMVSETASRGSVQRRIEWIHESMDGVRRLREEGIPMVGYTWWPMFSLIGWGYRQGDLPFHKYIVKMGLWDLEGEDLRRVRTPVVDEFIQVVARGSEAAGQLKQKEAA